MILFEHTVPALAIWLGLLAGLALVAHSFYRFVRIDLPGMVMAGLRLAFFLLLTWCLFLPQLRKQFSHLKKARFLVVADTSGSMALSPSGRVPPRWERVGQALEQPWVAAVQAECEVDAYPFAGRQGRRVEVDALRELTPGGDATRLRDTLQRLVDRYRGRDVAGMVLLTDGIDTEERHHGWARRDWPWPIYSLQVEPEGVWDEEPELRVDSLETPRRVTMGWQTELKTVISGQGTGGRPVHVRLLKDGALEEEIPIRIPREGGRREATFRLSHDTIGASTYEVVVPPYPTEAVTNDNRYAVSVQVVDAKNRLLYVEGPPRWESKFLTRALRANRQVTPVCFIRGPDGKFFTVGPRSGVTANMTESELGLFKIVVLGNLSATELGAERAENLLAFVDSGGSLLLLGGPKAWADGGYGNTVLGEALPVRSLSPEVLEEKTDVQLTGAGRSHAAFGGDSELWQALPPILSVYTGAELSAGAQVLASTTSGKAGENPVIVAQRYGQGKVVVLLTDSLWRWQLAPDVAESRPYQRFWDQLLAWLSPTASDLARDEVDLFAEKEHVYLGETIALNARLGGAARTDRGGGTLTCEVETPDGRRVPYAMSRQDVVTPTGRSLPGHTVTFSARQPGLHRATASWSVDGRRTDSESVSFFVKPFTPESMPRPPDVNVLRALARSSGGRFFESVDAMNRHLSTATFERTEERDLVYKSLWQRLPILACLLILASVEWVVRRWRNMP